MRDGRWGARGWRAAVALLSGVALTAAMSVGPSAPAEAYTYYRSGKPGKVVVLDQVQGTHYQLCAGTIVIGGVRIPACTWSPAIIAPRDKISRSSATKSAQRVTVTWYLQRVRGSNWYTHAKRTTVYTIPRGKSAVTSADWFVIPTAALYMRMVVKVNWKSVATGKTLGAYRAVFNQARDYRCATRFPCQVMSGSIWLKAPGA